MKTTTETVRKPTLEELEAKLASAPKPMSPHLEETEPETDEPVPDRDDPGPPSPPIIVRPPEPEPETPSRPGVPYRVQPTTAEKRWFKKVNVGLPFFVNKKPVPFTVIAGSNVGIIALDPAKDNDAQMIAALDVAAEAHKVGIVAIDEEIAEDIKKNPPLSRFAQKSQPPSIRVWESSPRPVRVASGSAVDAKTSSSPATGSHDPSAGVAGGAVAVAGTAATAFSPNLRRMSEGKGGPVLKKPSTGKFNPDVPVV